jgi:hypothetical protein
VGFGQVKLVFTYKVNETILRVGVPSLPQSRGWDVPCLGRDVPQFSQYFSPSSMCTFIQKLQSFSFTWLWRAFVYLSQSCVDVGMVSVNLRASLGPEWRKSNHGGRLRILFPPLPVAAGQPTQIFDGPLVRPDNNFKFEEKLPILRKRKSARSRSASPSNDRNE